MNLYNLTEEVKTLAVALDEPDIRESDGEELLAQWWAERVKEGDEALSGIYDYMRNLEAEARAFGEEAARLRLQGCLREARHQRLKELVLSYLQASEKKALQVEHGGFRRQPNGGPLRLIIDEGHDPSRFPGLGVAEWRWDKERIRQELENGGEIPFARFAERGEHLRMV